MIKKIFLIVISLIVIVFANRPIISVVMPTYNRGDDLLKRAIESVLAQDFKNFEFIIVDDGSTDDTEKIVKSYMEKDDRIRYIQLKENKGVSHARNVGNDAARGKYIAVMDSDDFATPFWLSQMYQFALERPELTCFISDRFYYTEPDVSKKTIIRWPLARQMFASSVANTGNMFKRNFIKKHNIRYDETIINGEDWDFYLKIGYAGGSIARNPRPAHVICRLHWSNPKQYYQKITPNAEQIKNILFTFLNIPKDKKDDQCFILKTARKKMPNYIPQKDWEDGLKTYCNK